MTSHFIQGTRPRSLQNEPGLFLTGDFTISPKRDWQDAMGIAAGGDVPAVLYSEGYNLRSEIKFAGMPIPTVGGALQGVAALEDAATLSALANLIDGELFGIMPSMGTIQSRDPEAKKARTGTGLEITFNLTHFYAMN